MLNLCRFGTDRSGSVAVLFSVVLVPALMLVGAATDYARVVASKAKLQSTADAAVLAAGLDVSGASDAVLQAKARAAIDAAFPAGSPVRVASVSLRTVNNNIVVTLNAETATNFGGFFGLSRVATVTTTAVPKQTGRKMDVDFLLDASASMGLAATPAGRDQLRAAVGCAFACHDPEGGQTISNLQVAQNLGVLTRLDVLKNAVGAMIGRIAATQGPRDVYRVAIDTFDDTPVRAVPLTTNLASAQQFIQTYRLGGNTSFSGAMPLFNGDVGSQGDGFSTPKKFAIIVTDGVQGRRDRVGGFHPFDALVRHAEGAGRHRHGAEYEIHPHADGGRLPADGHADPEPARTRADGLRLDRLLFLGDRSGGHRPRLQPHLRRHPGATAAGAIAPSDRRISTRRPRRRVFV